jgi:hypothetical protein
MQTEDLIDDTRIDVDVDVDPDARPDIRPTAKAREVCGSAVVALGLGGTWYRAEVEWFGEQGDLFVTAEGQLVHAATWKWVPMRGTELEVRQADGWVRGNVEDQHDGLLFVRLGRGGTLFSCMLAGDHWRYPADPTDSRLTGAASDRPAPPSPGGSAGGPGHETPGAAPAEGP